MKENTIFMEESPALQSIYPLLAPLPLPIAEHLLERFNDKKSTSSIAWDRLIKEVEQKRDIAFIYMSPFVETSQFSTGWFLETLAMHSKDKRLVPPQTFSNWHTRGLIRYEQHGLPDTDSAAALFITRMIDLGKRKWLPSVMKKEEPWWWCWRQDAPQMQPVPCPVPLVSASLKPETLLWTPWAGAAWRPEWLSLGSGLGAIRFYGVQKRGRHVQWTLSYEHLTLWCPSLSERDYPHLLVRKQDIYKQSVEEMRLQMLQTLATEVLQHLALSRFEVFRPYIVDTEKKL